MFNKRNNENIKLILIGGNMKKSKSVRNSNLELLRILCILAIIGDHFTGQSGIIEWGNIGTNFFYCTVTSLSRVACSVFIIISAWFAVEKSFNMKKVLHVWLTVIMFTVPITLYCWHIGIATKRDLFTAALPVSGSPLWFAGYYIVLMLLSPALNFLVNEAPKIVHVWLLLVLLVLMVVFSTITAELGFFGHDIWVLIFLYLLTGYIKKYKSVPDCRRSFLLFFVIWLLLTMGRACVANSQSNLYIVTLAQEYFEFYRARMQTIPNLLMAYGLFFGFYRLKIKSSKIINFLASKTLGVYCFHQVPTWYGYLWTVIFKSGLYVQILHGYKRMLYTIGSILAVWILGVFLETIREKISEILIENRNYYNNICQKINNTLCEKEDCENQFIKKSLSIIMVVMVLCIVLIKAVELEHYWYRPLNTNESLIGKNFDLDIAGTMAYNDGKIEGKIIITNLGDTIENLSDGAYPVNLGVHIVDSAGTIVDQDFQHVKIETKGIFKSGKKVTVDLILTDIDQYIEQGYGIKLEIVQEGISWFDDTAKEYMVNNKKVIEVER